MSILFSKTSSLDFSKRIYDLNLFEKGETRGYELNQTYLDVSKSLDKIAARTGSSAIIA